MASFGERVVGAMRLDPNTFEEIERDPTAMGQAAGVIALAAVSIGIGNMWYGGLSGILSQVVISLIGYAVFRVLDHRAIAIVMAAITLIFVGLWFARGGEVTVRPRSAPKWSHKAYAGRG